MIIGIPKEIKDNEYRVSLPPGGARELVRRGHTVIVEDKAGQGSGFANDELMGWCEALERFGTFSLADVMEPAIRHASRGFRVTSYLHECVSDCAADMALVPGCVVRAYGRPQRRTFREDSAEDRA